VLRRDQEMLSARQVATGASALLVICAWAAGVNAQIEDVAPELRLWGRMLRTEGEASKRVVLSDRTLAFLTKYELPNAKDVNSTAKVYALFGWQPEEKAIKYAVLALPTESLTAKTGADIKGLHLGVEGSRMAAAKAEMPLAKASGAFPMDDGYASIGAGTIADSNVSAWTNSLNIKTAAALWEKIEAGECYLTILTTQYPEGEVRGQIDWSYEDLEVVEDLVDGKLREDTDAWRLTFLTPNEATASVNGSKTARAMAIYAWDGSKILYHVVSGHLPTDGLHQVTGYSGITAVQLHVGAMRGAASNSVLKLTVPSDATWKTENGLKVYAQGSIGDADLKAMTTNAANSSAQAVVTTAKVLFDKLVAGETYTNILTAANPRGEVRGQNDWNYKAVDVLKDMIPAKDASKPGSSTSSAFSLRPSIAVVLGLCSILLL